MKTDHRTRLLLLAALALLGILVADQMVLEPLDQAWNERAERLTLLRKNVADGTQLLQREEALRKRWRQMCANTLPNNPALAEQHLLKAVDAWAQESHAAITGITPQWKHDADEYQTLGCRVDLASNLGTLTRFLYDLEKSPMALKLESVELVASDSLGQELTLGVRLSGLVVTPEGQP